MLVCDAYITRPKQFKILAVVGSIVVIGALACALFYSMCDLKVARMILQCDLCIKCLNWAIKLWKQLKAFVVQKGKVQLVTVQ